MPPFPPSLIEAVQGKFFLLEYRVENLVNVRKQVGRLKAKIIIIGAW